MLVLLASLAFAHFWSWGMYVVLLCLWVIPPPVTQKVPRWQGWRFGIELHARYALTSLIATKIEEKKTTPQKALSVSKAKLDESRRAYRASAEPNSQQKKFETRNLSRYSNHSSSVATNRAKPGCVRSHVYVLQSKSCYFLLLDQIYIFITHPLRRFSHRWNRCSINGRLLSRNWCLRSKK